MRETELGTTPFRNPNIVRKLIAHERHATIRQRRDQTGSSRVHRHVCGTQPRFIHARRKYWRTHQRVAQPTDWRCVPEQEACQRSALHVNRIVKGGEVSRSVPVNADGRRAIDELVNWHREHYRSVASKRPLFPSRHNAGTVPMHRQTAHAILKTAFMEAGLNGHIATHSLRKSFAQRLYDKTGDIYLVQELLGHRNISTTQKYLGVNYADAKAAVEAIALISESDRNHLSSRSWEEIDDETLRSELIRRGYNVTSRRSNETTAEIMKIG